MGWLIDGERNDEPCDDGSSDKRWRFFGEGQRPGRPREQPEKAVGGTCQGAVERVEQGERGGRRPAEGAAGWLPWLRTRGDTGMVEMNAVQDAG